MTRLLVPTLAALALAGLSACGTGGGGDPGPGPGPVGPGVLGFTAGPSGTIVPSFTPTTDVTLLNMRLADHDNDGTQDLGYVFDLPSVTDFRFESMRGLGDGTFGAVYPGFLLVSGTFVWMGTGEVLGPGEQGFAVGAAGPSTVGYRDVGGVPTRVGDSAGVLSFMGGIAVGDWDGDDTDDVALADVQFTDLLLWYTLGDRSIIGAPPQDVPGANNLTSGDWEGDGDDDVMIFTPSGYVTLTGPLAGTQVTITGSPFVLDPVTGDFDGDGLVDVAFVALGSGPAAIGFLRGRGDGTFDPLVTTTPTGVTLAWSATFPHMQAGDFDGDARTDLALVNPGDRTCVFLGTATGQFTLFEDPDLLGGANATLAVGDVDGDGDLDLVVGDTVTLAIRTLLNERL